jgi:hypothetical protein
MASIVLRNFGGMAPSANPKSLPESAATFVRNLDLRFGDFRPLPTPAIIGAATAGASLYKLEGAAGFITRPGVVNFVRGPIPNDPTERTYYSGDGAPKVTDLSGQVRQLGVPQPAAAPVVDVLVADEFSESDAVAARNSTLERVKFAVRGGLGLNAVNTYFGLSDAELAAKFLPTMPTYLLSREFAAFSIPGTMSTGGFVADLPSHNNLNDPRLGFRLEQIDGVMRAFVPLPVRVDCPTIKPELVQFLMAVEHPVTYAPFIKQELAESVRDNIAERIKVPDQNRDQCIARMRQTVSQFTELAEKGDAGSAMVRGQVTSFYARPDIAAQIEAAIDQAVSQTYSALFSYANNETQPLPVTGN